MAPSRQVLGEVTFFALAGAVVANVEDFGAIDENGIDVLHNKSRVAAS